jgi:hypothetical protein
LSALLADVALARMRPDSEPANTGTLRGDVLAWAEQYLDEMSSQPGRNMLRDVQSSTLPIYCATIIGGQLQAILDRYPDQPKPSVDRLINLVAAPTVFRILFSEAPLEVGELHRLVEIALSQKGRLRGGAAIRQARSHSDLRCAHYLPLTENPVGAGLPAKRPATPATPHHATTLVDTD